MRICFTFILVQFLFDVASTSLQLQAGSASIGHSAPVHPKPNGNASASKQPEQNEEDEVDCSLEEVDIELRIIEEILEKGYSKQLLPAKNGTDVVLEIHISDIPRISEIGSFFELDLFYSEVWHDKRLAYERSHPSLSRCVRNMTLDLDYLRRLWTPNVCIVNSKAAVIHSSPSENVFLILYADGRVWKNCRMLVRAPCAIDLRNFPFDTQVCSLLFESYSYNSQKVRLQWMKDPVAITLMKGSMHLADFHLVDYQAEQRTATYPNGHWDQLKATFVFERRYGFFIWQAFVPSYMTVGVAYITFWMDSKELCTRATLAISAFLAICLQFGNVQQNQPRVSYIKAMDVWMLASILFMFGALVELAIISYVSRRRDMLLSGEKESISPRGSVKSNDYKMNTRKISADNERKPLSEKENGVMPSPSTVCVRSFEESNGCSGHGPVNRRMVSGWWPPRMPMIETRCRKRKQKRAPLSPDTVDRVFLFLYPPCFFLFNLFYWYYFLPHGRW